MFKNYLIVAIRSFRQQKFYSALNISGLAIGMASAILVMLWIHDELNYDTHFRNSDKIYRIECSLLTEGIADPMISTDRRMSKYLRSKHSDFCDAVAIYKTPTLISSRDRTHYEEQAFYVDSTFFSVFSFDFIAGDPGTALKDSTSVVITKQVAGKLFGNSNPIGDTIWFNNHQTKSKMIPRVVTGVITGNEKASHFHPEVIFAKQRNLDVFEPVYVKIKNGYSPDYFKDQIWKKYYHDTISANYWAEKQNMRLDRFQPLTDIHLGGNKWDEFEANGDRALLYVFGATGLLILLLACINYINLATARSFSRSREIAVRKVLGASKNNIIYQFLTEAVVTALIALLIAFSMVEIVLPVFNDLADKQIHLSDMHKGLFFSVILLTVFMGLLAGVYPAFFLSSFQVADVIKDMPGRMMGKVYLRRSLVIFQFCISLILLITTIDVWRQLKYMRNSELGFDPDNILLITLSDENVYAEQEALKKRLLQHPNILDIASTHNVPGGGVNHTYIDFESHDGMKALLINSMFVDKSFVNMIRLRFIEGHNFDSSMHSDSAYVVLTESAKKQLEYDNAAGKKVYGGLYYGSLHGRIVGVVKDFHAQSLHMPIQPMALVLGTFGRPEGKSRYLMIKMKPDNIDTTISFIRGIYRSYSLGYPFNYTFLDEKFNDQYRKEEKQMTLFNSFTGISIFTSLLGLIGLATFFMKQRNKEICIRRISGASAMDLFYMLSRDYIALVAIAWILACPLAFMITKQWLKTFAYHISFRPYSFLAAGFVAVLFVLIAVLIQTITALNMKPANVLRHQ